MPNINDFTQCDSTTIAVESLTKEDAPPDLVTTNGNPINIASSTATPALSNKLAENTEVEVVTEEAEEPTIPEAPKDENEPAQTTETIENPKTNDSILLVLGTLAVSGAVAFVAKRKLS